MTAENNIPVPQVEKVIAPNPPPSIPPPKPYKTVVNLAVIIFIFILLIGIGSAAYYFYLTGSKKPIDLLTDSIEKTAGLTSATVGFKTDDRFPLTVSLNFHREEKALSELTITVPEINKSGNGTLNASIIGNKKDIYVKIAYDGISEILNSLKTIMPDVETMKTYQLALPIALGEKWLHLSVPEGLFESSASAFPTPTGSAEEKELEKTVRKFKDSLIIRSSQNNFMKNGSSYTRITLGLDKTKLIETLESLKDMDLDMKISEINNFLDIVRSVDTWDSDLLVILIDRKSGYLSEADFFFPEIPKEAVNRALNENTDNAAVSYLKNFSGQIDQLLDKQSKGELQHIGILNFDNYNSSPMVSRPQDNVEFEELSQAAYVEILPMVSQMLNSQLMPASSSSGLQPSYLPDFPTTKGRSSPPVYNFPTSIPSPSVGNEWRNWNSQSKWEIQNPQD